MDRRPSHRAFFLTLLLMGSVTSGCAHNRQVYYPNHPAASAPKVHTPFVGVRVQKSPAVSVEEPPILKDADENGARSIVPKRRAGG